MISASDRFKELLLEGTMVVNYATIVLRDGTRLELEPSDFVIGGFSMEDSTTNGKFEIGNALGKTMSMTIANHTNKFSAYDFYKSIIYVYVAVKDGTKVLKERKGKYYVMNPVATSDSIKIDGVDSMHLFDKPFNGSISANTTLHQVLTKCCLDCGVQVGFGQFDNYNYQIPNEINSESNLTYRQIVSYVCQIAVYNARINNDDKLELVWYDSAEYFDMVDGGNYFIFSQEDIIDGGNFTNYTSNNVYDNGLFTDEVPNTLYRLKSISVSTDDVTITGVSVITENGNFDVGFPLYTMKIDKNPLVLGKEVEVSQHLANKLVGLKFRPLTIEIPNNPLYEPFDSIYVTDRKGNEYFTFINSVSYRIHGFTTLSCKADDTVRNESSYVSEYAKAVVEARRNTEKQLSSYDLAVQAMNLLASNAMGLFNEREETSDGSNIFYMSNKPITKNDSGKCIFQSGSVVYKMTADGFFVSRNGGTSYESGFDQYGNAVLNVLSAIGINFDWAHGGTLTLGGSDNVNGRIMMYDSAGASYGKWDKDSLQVGGSNGFNASKSQVTIGGSNGLVANSTQLKINGDNGLVASSSGITIGGSNGLTATSSQIKIGGNNGLVATSSQTTIGGENKLLINADGVKIGGENGLVATSSQIKIGGDNGLVATASNVKIGGDNGLIATASQTTIGGSNKLLVNADGVKIGGNNGLVATSSQIKIGGDNGLKITSSEIKLGIITIASDSFKINSTSWDNGLQMTTDGLTIGTLTGYYTRFNKNGVSIPHNNGLISIGNYPQSSLSATSLKVNSKTYGELSSHVLTSAPSYNTASIEKYAVMPSTGYGNAHVITENTTIQSFTDKNGRVFYAFTSNPTLTKLGYDEGYLLSSKLSTSKKTILANG